MRRAIAEFQAEEARFLLRKFAREGRPMDDRTVHLRKLLRESEEFLESHSKGSDESGR